MGRVDGVEFMRDTGLNIALVDFYADGHHGPYIGLLARGIEELGAQVTVIGPKTLGTESMFLDFLPLNGCEALTGRRGLSRYLIASRLCEQAIQKGTERNVHIIHFVYADWHMSAIAAAWERQRPQAKLALTLHWLTGAGLGGLGNKERISRWPHRWALRRLVKKWGAQLYVHHDVVREKVSGVVGANLVTTAAYPVEILPKVERERQVSFRAELGVKQGAKVVLCYGGTRFDKGADLAIEAIRFLPDDFHLLIAGEAHYFQPQQLRHLATVRDVGSRVHLISKVLSEAETALVFYSSDIVLFPYRRIFAGQSGPMLLAAAIGKPVVVPDLPVLQNTVHTFQLGNVFPAENCEAMAAAVEAIELRRFSMDTKSLFGEQHAPRAFCASVWRGYLRSTK